MGGSDLLCKDSLFRPRYTLIQAFRHLTGRSSPTVSPSFRQISENKLPELHFCIGKSVPLRRNVRRNSSSYK